MYYKIDAIVAWFKIGFDDVKAQLDKKEDGELQTFIIIACVISGVSFCVCGRLRNSILLIKRKRYNERSLI